MKLAVSNIAWAPDAEPEISRLLSDLGIRGVEIAPTLAWPAPLEASEEEISSYCDRWRHLGIEPVAFQAILYGKPELTLFESLEARRQTGEYLKAMFRVAGLAGARVLVFGSPRNRRIGEHQPADARRTAVSFFRDCAQAAAEEGVVLCIEANPREYKCDFITRTEEARRLVEEVGHPGFGLHLDMGGITLAGDSVAKTIDRCAGAIRHFHASEPFLAPLGEGDADHAAAAEALHRHSYPHWVSLEMRRCEDREPVTEVRRAVTILKEHYGD